MNATILTDRVLVRREPTFTSQAVVELITGDEVKLGESHREKKLMSNDRSSPSVPKDWYYTLMGTTIGPLSNAELKQHVANGRVTRDTYIRKGEDGQWIVAEQVASLWNDPFPPSPSSSFAKQPQNRRRSWMPLLLAAANFGVAGVILFRAALSASGIGFRIEFELWLGQHIAFHLPIAAGFLIVQFVLPVLLVFVGIRLIWGRSTQLLGGLYGIAFLTTTLGFALYVHGVVMPATDEVERSLTRGGPVTLSNAGHGLRVEGIGGAVIIPWEYTGAEPFLSWMDMLLMLHAVAFLIILFVPPVNRSFVAERDERRVVVEDGRP